MNTDFTFFTNEPEKDLHNRFGAILKNNTQFFDVLVGYFRSSGFHLLYEYLENVEKIRILIGINTDNTIYEHYMIAKNKNLIIEEIIKEVAKELSANDITEKEIKGIIKFIEWIRNGKLAIRVYPKSKVHAKVYIIRKVEDFENYGSVITGSSNLSYSGLKNNLEFNVELKNRSDVDYALSHFEKLWNDSIEINEEYINIISNNKKIKKVMKLEDVYYKCLYEYFKYELENINANEKLPDDFVKLEYQFDAVNQAKRIIDKYNGVFISDVVGLGKTIISSLLAQKLKLNTLVICPPVLKEYWEKSLKEFGIDGVVKSNGLLDKISADTDLMKTFNLVIIDEAHKYRNYDTKNYEYLHKICTNKKVVLVTATPQNNNIFDIANQIYLFQDRNNSNILNNDKNIEVYFKKLERELAKSRDKDNYEDYLKYVSEKIRNEVLKKIMIRRTRTEIVSNYSEDLKVQGISFPIVNDPIKVTYILDGNISADYFKTTKLLKELKYSKYQLSEYLVNKSIAYSLNNSNISGFMKSLLIKRFESSFYAFKETVKRFINKYEEFIENYKKGIVEIYDERYEITSKKVVSNKIFNEEFIKDLYNDYYIFIKLKNIWESQNEDPKFNVFLEKIIKHKDEKLIVFTESKDTAKYIYHKLIDNNINKVAIYTGDSTNSERAKIEKNFDPNNKEIKNDINILITTDVLSEGMNLHRSNIIINYDLPWNPTKIMQRIGRINRIGSEFEDINIYNFFPTDNSRMHLSLEDNIIHKIKLFHQLLGDDFKYLTDDEIFEPHELYEKINNLSEEDNIIVDNLAIYLEEIKNLRKYNSKKYEFIKNLKSPIILGKNIKDELNVLSLIKTGDKYRFSTSTNMYTQEIDPEVAFEIMKSNKNKILSSTNENILEVEELIERNIFMDDNINFSLNEVGRYRTQNEKYVIGYIKAVKKINEYSDEGIYIDSLLLALENSKVPLKIINDCAKELKKIKDNKNVIEIFRKKISDEYLKKNIEVNKDNNIHIASLYY